MQTIVTLTVNPAIDVNTEVESVVSEHKLRCAAPTREAGGGGINVSRALKRLGGSSQAVWTHGGPTGDLLAQLLDTEGVAHVPVPLEGLTRENLIVYEKATGQQYRFGMPGAPMTHQSRDRLIKTLLALDPVPDILVASGSLPPGLPEDFYARVARAGRDRGVKVVVDTSGEALRLAAQSGVWLLKPNLRELGHLVGRELGDEQEVQAAAMDLVESGGAEVVLVSLGAGGGMLVSAEHCLHVRSPTVPIRSKVGAGDSTVAGFVLAVAQGRDLLDAARYAIAAGAAAVMTPGTELCRKEDADRIFDRLKSGALPAGD